MKRLLSLIIIIIFALNGVSVSAKIRTSAEVLTIAEQHFISNTTATRIWSAKVVKTISASEILPQAQTKSANGGEPFYVLVASNGSNVIVSGDDRMPTIIGYSEYEFDKNNVNDGLKALLSAYAMAYNDLQTTGTSKLEMAPKTYTSTGFPSEVKPLLDGIAWNQAAPYNGMSPIVNNSTGQLGYTGCVTTAMAMIMRYHKHPASATGRGVGAGNDINLGQSPFDWTNMLKRYTENHTTDPKVSRDAVAWLMRACGAALETKYYGGSSGSGQHMIAQVFANNFGYDQGVVTISRRTKSYRQWTDILKAELSEGRPILYAATQYDMPVGHAVVFDGYDTNGLYYVNWGWTTSNNGYYDVTSLGSYMDSHGATIGIRKPTGATYVSKFDRSSEAMNISPTTIARNDAFSLEQSWRYTNRGDTFTGKIGLVLFQDGKLITEVGEPMSFENILRNHALPDDADLIINNPKIPGNVPNGNYQLYVASKDGRESEWQPVMMDIEQCPYYNVSITSSQIVFSNSADNQDKVKLVSFTMNPEKIYIKEYIVYTMKLQNDGSEVNAYVKVVLTPLVDGERHEILVGRYPLSPGMRDLQFSNPMTALPGDYKVDVRYSSGGVEQTVMRGSESIKNITVHPEYLDKYDYNIIGVSAGMEKKTVTNKDGKPRLILELTGVGTKDIVGGTFMLNTTNKVTKEVVSESIFGISLKVGETKKFVLESASTLLDGDYTFDVYFVYPSGGTHTPSPTIPNAKGKYEFGIRTL